MPPPAFRCNRRLVSDSHGKKGASATVVDAPQTPQRIYAAHETDFLNLVAQVHLADTGCSGPLTSDGAQHERSTQTAFRCACMECGADFGRLRVGGTQSVATVLGVLLAGSTYHNFSASLEYSDQKALSHVTFNTTQKPILRMIDRLWEEHLATNNEILHGEPKRKKVVPVKEVYILHNKAQLLEKMEGDCGLKVRTVVLGGLRLHPPLPLPGVVGCSGRNDNIIFHATAANWLKTTKRCTFCWGTQPVLARSPVALYN